jgi:hypothetical protein
MSRQVSVPLDAALLRFLERMAERESRTVAGQIRHFIVEAMSHAGDTTAGSEPWPRPLAVVSRDNLSELKALVKDMEAERNELVAAKWRNHPGLMPYDEVRLQYLLETIKCLQSHIAGIDRLTVGNNHGQSESPQYLQEPRLPPDPSPPLDFPGDDLTIIQDAATNGWRDSNGNGEIPDITQGVQMVEQALRRIAAGS